MEPSRCLVASRDVVQPRVERPTSLASSLRCSVAHSRVPTEREHSSEHVGTEQNAERRTAELSRREPERTGGDWKSAVVAVDLLSTG